MGSLVYKTIYNIIVVGSRVTGKEFRVQVLTW